MTSCVEEATETNAHSRVSDRDQFNSLFAFTWRTLSCSWVFSMPLSWLLFSFVSWTRSCSVTFILLNFWVAYCSLGYVAASVAGYFPTLFDVIVLPAEDFALIGYCTPFNCACLLTTPSRGILSVPGTVLSILPFNGVCRSA